LDVNKSDIIGRTIYQNVNDKTHSEDFHQ
jgi:hypothetical protein